MTLSTGLQLAERIVWPVRKTENPELHSTTSFPLSVRLCLVTVVASFTIFDRFGLNIGTYSLGFSLIAQYILVAMLFLMGFGRIDRVGFWLYAAFIAIATASLIANTEEASLSSYLLLGTIYLPFIASVQDDPKSKALWRQSIGIYANFAVFCAACGITQFGAQFVTHAPWLFDYTPLLPEAIRGNSGYNTVIPIGTHFKSNGFFFKEPSGFSQNMAVAIIAEVAVFRRYGRIAILGLGLLLSYSGTGLAVLAIASLFPINGKTILRAIVLSLAALFVFATLGGELNLSFTVSRVGEFGARRSSAYMRFVAPFELVSSGLDKEGWTSLLGHGPGSVTRTLQRISSRIESHDPTWAKLIYEYGVFGFISSLSLITYRTFRSSAPVEIRASLFTSWLLMGGHLLTVENTSTLYVISVMFVTYSRSNSTSKRLFILRRK